VRGAAAAAVAVLVAAPGAADAGQALRGHPGYDVVVYGATAGGTMAAIAAAQEGARVALVDPGAHVGGMLSGGLGRTDMDRQEHVIGGLARGFFERVGRHYGREVAWTFEPGVAERTLRAWLDEAGVHLYPGHRLSGVDAEGGLLRRVRCGNGATFDAAVFVDASYEADLMKAAGVSYAIGREGRARYGESWSGRRELLPGNHQLLAAVPALDAPGRLLPYVQPPESLGAIGEGDHRIQAYCFRLCLTRDPANRLEVPRPERLDPARFGLVYAYLRALGDRATLGHFLGISEMPNRKTDVNAGGGVSTNLNGASWEYPEASPERRAEIWREHLDWAHGLVWLLGSDPAAPERVRAEMSEYGLARDEFVDTGHWPHQLYVREGRRMLGEHVLTQHDLEANRTKHDTIGMAGYNIDIREIQWVAVPVPRFPSMQLEVLQEGYLSVPVEPWEIPYRSLLPRAAECRNLLVSAAVSASHVAYASFRMEPQYMIAGESAGVAAALAVRSGRPVHAVDLVTLQARLRERGQVLSLADARPR
jgi:hypothetical protein